MNHLLQRFDLAGLSAVAAALFLQSSLVLLFGLTASFAIRTRAAAIRSALLRATLAAVVLTPFASLALHAVGVHAWTIPLAQAQDRSAPVATPGDNRLAISAPTAALPTISTPQLSKTPNILPTRLVPKPAAPPAPKVLTLDKIHLLIVSAWLGIAALLLVRLLIANIVLWLARRHARPASESIRQACDQLARSLGLKSPHVLVNPKFPTPCLTGLLRPAIVLPTDTDPGDEVLIHELAHILRRDCAWQLLARIATAGLWFQPLLWLLSRQIERTAEEACDDFVLVHGCDCAAYARRLLDLAERRRSNWAIASAGVGAIAIKSAIGKRVSRLMRLATQPRIKVGKCALATLALLVVALAAGVGKIGASFAAGSPAAPSPQPGVTYAGKVYLPDGRPAAGAVVYLVPSVAWLAQVIETATCDVDGQFSFSKAPPQSIDLQLRFQVYLHGYAVATGNPKAGKENDIHLATPTRITVRLLDLTGAPVPRLTVFPELIFGGSMTMWARQTFWAMRPTAQLAQRLGGTTDANGSVTLDDLPRNAHLGLGFHDDRFASPGISEEIQLIDDRATPGVTRRLEAGATITGHVTFGTTGRPAAGVRVYAQGTNRDRVRSSFSALTNATGFFRISQIPSGEYSLMLALAGEMERDWTAFAHEALRVEPGQAINGIDFKLIKGGIVTGKVTSADTGEPIIEPINGTRVAAQGPAHPRSSASVQSLPVGADGTYTLRVPPGRQYVYVQGPVPEAYREPRQNIREVTVADGQTVTLDFKVPRSPGKPVEGIVLDPDGKPVANIMVTARQAGRPLFDALFRTTDAQGKFHFDILGQATELTARDDARATTQPVDVDGGETGVELRLVRLATLAFTGTVTDMADKPIAGAEVKLSEMHGTSGMGGGDSIRTGADGRYVLKDLYIGTKYFVATEADGYDEAQMQVPVDVAMGDLAPLRLRKLDEVITGQVVDSDGKPVKGIPVILAGGMFPKTALTDPDGRFSFPTAKGKRGIVSVRLLGNKPGPTKMLVGGISDLKLVVPASKR